MKIFLAILLFVSSASSQETLADYVAQHEVTIDNLRRQLSILETELEVNSVELHSLKKRNAELESQRDKLELAFSKLEAAKSKAEDFKRAKLAPPKEEPSELEVFRENLDSGFSEIQSKFRKRRIIAYKLSKKERPVSIRIQRLRTEEGLSLKELKDLATEAKSEEEVEKVLVGLSEVSRILDEDIQVLKRIEKL
mgnify:CR=1 FL=1